MLVGISFARSAPALSADDAEVLRSFFRIEQIVKKINISGFLSEPLRATLDADPSSANLNNRMTENKTDAESEGTLETEQNTEDPGQWTTASLGENKEFMEDENLRSPTTTTPTIERQETTTAPNDYYDTPHTHIPEQFPCDYSYSEGEVVSNEMYDLQEQHPTKLSTVAEELETVGGDANENENGKLSNSQDVNSEEASSGRGGLPSGPELTKLDSGTTFKLLCLL